MNDPVKANHDLYNMAKAGGWRPPAEGMPRLDDDQRVYLAKQWEQHKQNNQENNRGEAAPAPRKLSFLTADAIAEMDIPKVSTIIPGYLTEGTFVMGCYSGGGKTWLALQLANSVANGCSFLGVKP